jgi:hypothetical protein
VPKHSSFAQTFSPFPSNLIAVWEDLHFIGEFQKPSRPQGTSSDNFDATYDDMYIQILSRNSQALLILRVVSIWPATDPWTGALDLLGLRWNELRPLAALRRYWSNGWTLGQSLLDFLQDPSRAGVLYATRQELSEFAALCCISRVRQALVDVDGFLLNRYVCSPNLMFDFFSLSSLPNWLTIIGSCTPSDSVLHELENLDLTQFCARICSEPEFHFYFHQLSLDRDSFQPIVNWLRAR